MIWDVRIIEVGALPDTSLGAYVVGAMDDIVLDLPCFCWLLLNGKTSVLIDTGPDTHLSGDVGYEVKGDPRGSLLSALKASGVEPAGLDMIIHTHLHHDHIQNNSLFANAEVVVQRSELEGAREAEAKCAPLTPAVRRLIATAPWARSQEAGIWYIGIKDFEKEAGERLRVVDGEAEVLPGVSLLPNGGHTPGHQSVLVSTSEGPACISGDIIPLAINRDVVGPATPRKQEARAFLQRVHNSAWEIIPSHDKAMRSHRWYSSGAARVILEKDEIAASSGQAHLSERPLP
jgi:glyoxylase-like metal-dependent hydrolase (beta-lactamase superfamily II)